MWTNARPCTQAFVGTTAHTFTITPADSYGNRKAATAGGSLRSPTPPTLNILLLLKGVYCGQALHRR